VLRSHAPMLPLFPAPLPDELFHPLAARFGDLLDLPTPDHFVVWFLDSRGLTPQSVCDAFRWGRKALPN